MQRNINRKWILKRCLSPQARAGGGRCVPAGSGSAFAPPLLSEAPAAARGARPAPRRAPQLLAASNPSLLPDLKVETHLGRARSCRCAEAELSSPVRLPRGRRPRVPAPRCARLGRCRTRRAGAWLPQRPLSWCRGQEPGGRGGDRCAPSRGCAGPVQHLRCPTAPRPPWGFGGAARAGCLRRVHVASTAAPPGGRWQLRPVRPARASGPVHRAGGPATVV